MFTVQETDLKGCLRILPIVREDSRGTFIKTFSYRYVSRTGTADILCGGILLRFAARRSARASLPNAADGP